VTLRCTSRELTVEAGNWCPSYVDEFRVGAVRPFRVEPIPSRQARAGESAQLESVRLIAATGPSSAIVASATWKVPFQSLTPQRGFHVEDMVESLLPPSGIDGDHDQGCDSGPSNHSHRLVSHVLPRWGMSQGTIYLGKSSNQGRSWTLLSQGSMGATAGSIPFVAISATPMLRCGRAMTARPFGPGTDTTADCSITAVAGPPLGSAFDAWLDVAPFAH